MSNFAELIKHFSGNLWNPLTAISLSLNGTDSVQRAGNHVQAYLVSGDANFEYHWSDSASYTFTGNEPIIFASNTTLLPVPKKFLGDGDSVYLHVRALAALDLRIVEQ